MNESVLETCCVFFGDTEEIIQGGMSTQEGWNKLREGREFILLHYSCGNAGLEGPPEIMWSTSHFWGRG